MVVDLHSPVMLTKLYWGVVIKVQETHHRVYLDPLLQQGLFRDFLRDFTSNSKSLRSRLFTDVGRLDGFVRMASGNQRIWGENFYFFSLTRVHFAAGVG